MKGESLKKAEGYDLHGSSLPVTWIRGGSRSLPFIASEAVLGLHPIQSSVLTRGSQIYSGFENRPGDEW